MDLRPGFIVGRTTGDLIIEGSSLSGKHAQFLVEKDESGPGLFIIDLHSKNRTVVNRSEIPPGEKIRLEPGYLIEMGGQSFLITNNRTLTLKEVNEMVERYEKKGVVKLEGIKAVQEIKDQMKVEVNRLEDNKTNIVNDVVQKESKLAKLQEEFSKVDDHTKAEIQKLQEVKNRLIAEGEHRKKTLGEQISTLTKEIEEEKAQIQKIRMEVELKKKKIINLKAVGND